MTNFILPYSQKRVLTQSVHDDPFSIFDCLRVFYDKIVGFSISLDSKNAVSVDLLFDSEIELNENFFFQFPMVLMSAKKIALRNSKTQENIELNDCISLDSEQRFFNFATKLKKITAISFDGLYPSKIPSKLSNYDELMREFDNKKLLQLPPDFDCKSIQFSHFGNHKLLKQYCYNSDDSIVLMLRPRQLNYNMIIKPITAKKRVIGFDFNHPDDQVFAKNFEKLFVDYVSKNVSFELYIWNDKSDGSISKDPRADSESQTFYSVVHDKVATFLCSAEIKEMEKVLEEKKLLAAVNLLDKRKNAISVATKVTTTNGFRFKVPSNEYETIILFTAMVAEQSHPFHSFELHEYASSQGIDSFSTYKIRPTDVAESTRATEFEYKLSNFFKHGHPIQHTHIIICWMIDPCPYEVNKTEFPWLYKLNIDGHFIPIVEIKNFPNLKVVS